MKRRAIGSLPVVVAVVVGACSYPDFAFVGDDAGARGDTNADASTDGSDAIDATLDDSGLDSLSPPDADGDHCRIDDAATCNGCIVGHCNAQLTACGGAACMTFFDCVGSCGCVSGFDCYESCRKTVSSTLVNAYANCVESSCTDPCAKTCAGPSSCE